MGYALKGYVLERPRVGSANSPFTASPDNYVSDSVAYAAAYPTGSEPNPRADYLVLVHQDGNLPTASFDWTKNEGAVVGGAQIGFQRFDYEGREQRFKLLPGGPPSTAAAPLGPNSNTTRLTAPKPALSNLTLFPMRIAVGSVGSGTTFTIALVPNDGAFSAPSAGTVQLSLTTGNLNWNTTDLTTYSGQIVRFQQQGFFSFTDSNGHLGVPPATLVLNPLPATGQFPVVRIGYGLPLTPIQVPNEGAFSLSPAAGTFEWALTTGRINLSPVDVAANLGKAVYYDGVVLGRALTLPSSTLGSMPAGYTSLSIAALPPDGGDLVFRAGTVQFPQFEMVTSFADSVGKAGVVQVLRVGLGGEARFSLADRTSYAGQTVTLTTGDLPVDHGISLRLFRNPVNLGAGDPSLKDVTALYPVTDATFADPVIGAPQVFLPSLPVDSLPLTVRVEQGTGSFTGALPRLDVASPPAGLGYVLDLDQRLLQYAQRKNQALIPTLQPVGGVMLPDPLVLASNVVLELETGTGTGIYMPLTVGVDALFDNTSGAVSFTSTQGTLVTSGTGGSTASTTFTDPAKNFALAGVAVGDSLLVPSGAAAGIYLITAVGTTTLTLDAAAPTAASVSYEVRHGREIVADRFFSPLVLADPQTIIERVRALGAVSNAPRLTVMLAQVGHVRFRFGATTMSTLVTVVPNDGYFSPPTSIPSGVVQVSAATGNLNFSELNLGETVYGVFQLQQSKDYRLTPPLGLIDYTERALTDDEGYLTYLPASGSAPVTEPATFLVRKEVTQPHTTPTSILHFNPTGKHVASQPAPAVYRGGRPQTLNVQCVVDTTAGTIRFLPDNQVTDALPHGAIVAPTERVYIDYYVTQAFGGEKTTTVLQPPMTVAQFIASAGDTGFLLSGDWTATFRPDLLFRIEKEQVYLISAATYDTTSNVTTVQLAAGQSFRDDVTNPNVFLASGPTPTSSTPARPSYFVLEAANWNAAPRGTQSIVLVGDRTATYPAGTVVYFQNATGLNEFYQVTGSTYDKAAGATTVLVAENFSKQYAPGTGGALLYRSVRPVLEASTSAVSTSLTPILTQPYTVYRRVMGQPGSILTSPADYAINDSGRITFASALLPNEEFGILYTGHRSVGPGPRVRASYTSIIVPTASNGLLGQVLKSDYTIDSPDSFYYRVETFTNFKGELAQQYEDDAKSAVPSNGPNTSNAGQTKLSDQGRPSVFFAEGHLANEDIVARSTLVFYNDGINYLEDVLQNLDGRVVGHRSGRFRFDGLTTNAPVTTMQAATNQIDDQIKVSDAPYQVSFTFPTFTLVSVGTYQALYLPSAVSRFFPTFRHSFGVAAAGVATGDAILDTGAKNLTSVENVRTRPAFARVTQPAVVGATTLTVDAAQGSATTIRPPFLTGMKCVVQLSNGTFLVPDGSPIVVSATSPTSIAFAPGLPVAVPAGATIYRAPSDDSNASGSPQPGVNENVHYPPASYGFAPAQGQLTYVKAMPPLDGSASPVPVPNALVTKQIPAGQALSADVYHNATSTTPARFPALDGGTVDDDGEVTLPLVGPSFAAELTSVGGGLLANEIQLIQSPSGTLRTATTAPFVGTGNLDALKTTITLTAGTFPSPVPVAHDLVRITSGVNGTTSYRRVVTATANSVTVDTAFASVDTGFTFVVGVSAALITGAAAIAGTTLTDLFADFVAAGVQPGHTVVLTTGVSTGERRQVLTVDSTTQLTLASTASSGAYRVTNSLIAFGGAPTSLLEGSLVPDLQGEVVALGNERTAIEAYLNLVFTDIVTPSTASASATTLTDPSATFVSSGVTTNDLVFIRTGSAAGIYQVASVVSDTSITVASAFPTPDLAAGYRVVSFSGVGFQTLTYLVAILLQADAFLVLTQSFLTLVTTPVSVVKPGPVVDPLAFARATLTTDLNTRYTQATTRQTYINNPSSGPVALITNALSGTERLYDKRFTWIDARINLGTGILVKQTRAVADRIQAQQDVVNQLTKLLAVSP
jgi:hypothetical protein